MVVVVSGYSDDLIELEGDVVEEFTAAPDDNLLAFSTGDVLRIRYSAEGVWRIALVVNASGVELKQAPEGDEDNYSDRATVPGEVQWAVLGTLIVRR